jgi:biopolymer transport protein ExbD
MLSRRRHFEEGKMNITPMIDMTFLLLVFFMVTSKITKEQKKLEVRLPVAASATVPVKPGDREIINLDARGHLFAGDRAMTLPEMKAWLKQRLADYPPLKISVRADARTPARQIKEIMQAAAEAGAIEVVFGTYKK